MLQKCTSRHIWRNKLLIKAAEKSVDFHFLTLKYYHRNNQMLQFWCADGSNSKEDKEEFIEVEAM